MKYRIAVAGMVFLLVGCTAGPSESTSTTASGPDPSSTTQPVTTSITTPESTTTSVPGCPGDGEFIEAGPVVNSPQPTADSERIGLISWNTTQSCEVFTIEMVTAEGAPATTPPSVTAEMLREVGILRVDLDVTGTAITDQLVQSGLVDRLYVVRQFDGSLFVDLILGAAATARVSTAGSPGVVTIELQPGGSDYPAGPYAGGLFLVTSPAEGEVQLPIPVLGYGRPFEANVVIQVSQGSSIVTETFTNSADYIDTWGEFALEVETPARGPANLFVGEFSANDGSPSGVVIPIRIP
ncbi:MAG TPA: Gmad2 immunoglobulin-like domain-containing protein [Acidimicrobiia bacterium]|nr:Gmad2 immunoglobulin-like domain-containing protein [Acidimicrobiia bacterium]